MSLNIRRVPSDGLFGFRIAIKEDIIMKLGINVVAVLVALMGGVWFFQGIGVIQGSFMSNTTQWTIIGLVFAVVGVGLLIYNNRRAIH